MQKYRIGDRVRESGFYLVVGPDGTHYDSVKLERGQRFPMPKNKLWHYEH